MTGTPITLAHPIVVEGKTTTTVQFRRAKTRELLAIEEREKSAPDEGQLAHLVWLIGLLTGLTEAELSELDAADLKTLGSEVALALGEDRAEPAKT